MTNADGEVDTFPLIAFKCLLMTSIMPIIPSLSFSVLASVSCAADSFSSALAALKR